MFRILRVVIVWAVALNLLAAVKTWLGGDYLWTTVHSLMVVGLIAMAPVERRTQK